MMAATMIVQCNNSLRQEIMPFSYLHWHRHCHTSCLNDVPIWSTWLSNQSSKWAAKPMAYMSIIMLIVTSPDIIANFLVLILHIPTWKKGKHKLELSN
jgi:hypothetical protein